MKLSVFGVGLALLLLGASPAVAADKISGEILAHQKEKSQPAGRTMTQHRAALLSQGLNPDLLDAEQCALYVRQRLTQDEISKLAAQGITINPDVWVPPVPGKHEHGFHLASVPYDHLEQVRQDDRFVFADSTEYSLRPCLDKAVQITHVLEVQNGTGVSKRTGKGVRIAVADTGLDRTHADIPTPIEAYDVTDGTGLAAWGTDVSNHVTGHGTFTTGIVVGRGTLSGGRYRGVAPDAELCFYKAGNDTTASFDVNDGIEAVNRALAVGCKVFSYSVGGYTSYMDGSAVLDQAIDAAVAGGMVCFVAAGNEATKAEHASNLVPPGTTSPEFTMTVNNTGTTIYTGDESIRVIWRDNQPASLNITLNCTNLGAGETLTLAFSGSSTRQTEAGRYTLKPSVAAGSSKTYRFTLQNTATSGTTPLVHCYRASGRGKFDNPDPNYTVASPAHADGAIAVGCLIHKNAWTDYRGLDHLYSPYVVGSIASYSSRGPRVDGLQKPDITAPGALIVTTRDHTPGLASDATSMIDNDGLNQNGSGPADYFLVEGTSMACPFAAGVAALLLEDRPSWTPVQVRARLQQTASQSTTPDTIAGYGLINALAAVSHLKGDFDGDGHVNAADYSIFRNCATRWGLPYNAASLPAGCSLGADGSGVISADFDHDHDVDQADFGSWQVHYGK